MSEPKAAGNSELAQLEKKLTEVRARAAARAAAELEAKTVAELKAKIRQEELELVNAEKLDELVAKYGPLDVAIRVVPTVSGSLVVMKRPNHVLYKRFVSSKEKEHTYESMDKLVSACRVYPEPEQFNQVLENEDSALIVKSCNEILWLGGHRAQDLEGK
jgi:hypothetical protein